MAPLLPITTGILGTLHHFSPWGLLGIQQLFYVATVVATYLLARHLSNTKVAALSAATVASLPGLIVSSHLFILAEPAAALFVVTMYLQIKAAEFQSLRRAIAWGVSLGLFSLTRTMVLALIPAFLIVAGLRAVTGGTRRGNVRNLLAGSTLAIVVGLSWYATSWTTVWRYLTQFGYGTQSNLYTGSVSLSLTGRIWDRLSNFANQDVYLPILLSLLVVLACRLLTLLNNPPLDWLRRRRELLTTRSHGLGYLTYIARSDYANIVVVVVLGAAVLSTSSNSGSYFELPLVPAIVLLVLVPLGKSSRLRQGIAAACVILGCGVTLVDQYGVAPTLAKYSSVSWGRFGVTAFNAALSNLGGDWWSNCGGATITCFYGRTRDITPDYLRSWSALNDQVVSFVYSFGTAHGYQPVVFVAYQGPLLNTNTLGLTAQIKHRTLPIGALLAPVVRQGVSLQSQLERPDLGQPNFVLAQGPIPARVSKAGSGSQTQRQVVLALNRDHFVRVDSFPLPGEPPLEIWWRDR